jgi:membrane protease YdiL (CAAX protease family)
VKSAGRRSGHGDRFASALRGFGPVGILAVLVIFLAGNQPAPFAGLLVLAWAWRSGTPWREIGYVRPLSWIRTLSAGIALGVGLKLLMKAIVMPLFGADPINQPFHHLVGNTGAVLAAVWGVTAGAGFGEETFFRGFLFERLGKLLGDGAGARSIIVVLTASLFAVVHYSLQGMAGVQQALVVGLVFGAIYAVTGRIWMLIIAHAAFDLTALAIIYWDLETRVAHLVFR